MSGCGLRISGPVLHTAHAGCLVGSGSATRSLGSCPLPHPHPSVHAFQQAHRKKLDWGKAGGRTYTPTQIVVTGIPLAYELLRTRSEPLFMVLTPALSTHPGGELGRYGLSCWDDG